MENVEQMFNGPVKFSGSLEAAAYAVCLTEMTNKENFSIEAINEGFELKLKEPIPLIVHLGIMGGIEADKKINPQKWSDTQSSITKRSRNNENN